MTRIVVGLGNPGPEYHWSRHNVGFHVLDAVARRAGVLFQRSSALEGWHGSARFDWARLSAERAFLLKPMTYMNRSGEAVLPVVRWLAKRGELELAPAEPDGEPTVDASQILVVYDDMDLEACRLRIRPFGGAGGQNGMRSIIERLDTDRFPRLRVGIGRPATDAARHVLESIPEREREEFTIAFEAAADAILAWLSDSPERIGIAEVMTRFHSRWNQDA